MRKFKPVPEEPVQPPLPLQADEWAWLKAAFDGTGVADDSYTLVLTRLQDRKNVPTAASVLFAGCNNNVVDNGQGWINYRLMQVRLPFRLATIDTFGPRNRKRLLAIKRAR